MTPSGRSSSVRTRRVRIVQRISRATDSLVFDRVTARATLPKAGLWKKFLVSAETTQRLDLRPRAPVDDATFSVLRR
jgi:hypothetical protein